MKTILLATDFSPAAFNAANYAADMAFAIHADLLLLHIFQIPVSYYEIPVSATVENMMKDAKNSVNQLKEKLLLKTEGKLTIHTEIRMGAFYPELQIICEYIKPFLVVMGSQGTTSAERLLYGGHTVYAMKHLKWPLITVPPKAKFSAIKKIGLASDFSEVVETTPVDEIITLVNDFEAELYVLNIGRKEVVNPNIVIQSGLLQEMLANLKPQYHFLNSVNADESILHFAENNHLDLLLVLPKRHGLLDSLTHLSHTKQLVLHSHVPVMALHQ